MHIQDFLKKAYVIEVLTYSFLTKIVYIERVTIGNIIRGGIL